MAKVTPPLSAQGKYVLKTPFSAASNMSYKCIALRRVEELTKAGVDIFKTIYEPMKLSQDVYLDDLKQGVVFVTLLGVNGTRIIVPDTFVESYPDQSVVNYNYTVVSVDFGPQPSTFGLKAVMHELQQVAAKYTGIDPANVIVNAHHAMSTTNMTQAEYIAAESAREAAISTTKTPEEEIAELRATIAQQDKLIQELFKQQN